MDSSLGKIKWIAAHLIYDYHVEHDGQRLVEEDIVLFRNSFEGEAEQLAIKYGEFNCESNPPHTFAGIRKMVLTDISLPKEIYDENAVQLSYSYFEVAGEERLAELVSGAEVTIKYIE